MEDQAGQHARDQAHRHSSSGTMKSTKTAKALGLTMLPSILFQADEVLQ
jgi:hypothetical protein